MLVSLLHWSAALYCPPSGYSLWLRHVSKHCYISPLLRHGNTDSIPRPCDRQLCIYFAAIEVPPRNRHIRCSPNWALPVFPLDENALAFAGIEPARRGIPYRLYDE